MSDTAPLVVATDFSDAAAPALAWAVRLAEQQSRPLHVLSVALMAESTALYPLFSVSSDTEGLYNRIHKHCERGLEKLLASLDTSAEVTPVVRHAASASTGVLDYLEEVEGALLIIGTHGRRGFRRWLMGSVAEEVVRRAKCPVLCCHPEEAGLRSSASAPVETIVAAVDFSAASDTVVKAAVSLSESFGAALELLHAVPDPLVPVRNYLSRGVIDMPTAEEITARAQQELDEFCDQRGLGDAVERHVALGKAWQVIVSVAKAQGASLLVIASRTAALETAFLGSVTHGVLRNADCPVLVVAPEAGSD